MLSQVAIFGLGTSAIVLVAMKNKWGFVIGIISQPFWFITSFINQQWGVFLVSIVYTLSWAFGIYEWFSKDRKKKPHSIHRHLIRR